MADNEKLQLGLSLQVDLDAFEAEWKNKQAAIQKIINGHTFDVKIGGIQGLAEVQKEMERFARGVRASSNVDLVNTDSIKGLKDQVRALEQEWANLSKQQKFANESTRELTPYAVELATRYAELRAELERYGMSLKEAEKAGRSFAANRARIAAEDITQPDFELLQMAEYYKIVERESAKAYEAKQKEQQIEAQLGRTLAEAVILQNQMTQARNADYVALKKQIQAESELAEKLHYEALRREAYQSIGQRDFESLRLEEYYKVLEKESAEHYENERREIEKNAAELEKVRKKQEEIANESQRVQRILSQTPNTINAINERLSIQRKRLAEVALDSPKYNEISRDIKSLEAHLRSLNDVQQRNITTTNAQTVAYQHQSGALNGLKQFINSYISLLGGYRLLNNIKQITSEFELQRVSLRAITQDAEFADALFAKIKATAVESPFATKDLVTYTKQLAAYRIENEELYGTMTMLADISAGLGVSMDRLILAYGQVKAASVLRGTELRQFTEAGIPLVDELAKKFSQLRGEVVSTGEVFDLISTRQVPFEMVADIFKEMTAEGGRFYEMQKKQSESLYGVFENLKDNIQNAFDEIGQSNRGLLMGIGKLATAVAKNLSVITGALTPLVAGWGAYVIAMKLVGTETSRLAVSNALLAKAEAALDISMNAANATRARASILIRQAAAAHDRYTYALAKAAAANNVFTRSLYKMRAALVANPVTAILTAVATVVAGAITLWNRYLNSLSSANKAQEKVAEYIEQVERPIKNMNTQYERLIKKIKEYDILIKTQGKSLSELKKIYPEIFKQYQTDAERQEAVNRAMKERVDVINQLKSLAPEQLSAINAETATVDELATAWKNVTEEQRKAQLQSLEAKKSELEALIRTTRSKNVNITQQGTGAGIISGIMLNKRNEAAIAGYEEQLAGIQKQIEAINKTEEQAANLMVLWRQEYAKLNKLLKDGLSEEDLARLSFPDAIEKTRAAWKTASQEVEYYSNALKTATDLDLISHYTAMRKVAQDTKDAAEAFAKFGNFSLITDTKKDTTLLDNLKAELPLVEKIYKRYQDLRKLMSDEAAKANIEEIYGGLTNVDFLSPEKLRTRLQKMLEQAEKLDPKDLAIQLGLKIQDIDTNEIKDKLEKALSRLSNQIKQQQDASEFFEKMLGWTGDIELSTNLTLATTGVDIQSGNIGQMMSRQLAEILSTEPVRAAIGTEIDLTGDWNADDLEDAISKGEISVRKLQELANKLPKDVQPQFREALASFVDFSKGQVSELFKTIDKYGDVETKIALLKTQFESKKLDFSSMVNPAPDRISKDEWAEYIRKGIDAAEKAYNEELGKVKLEGFQKQFVNELENLDGVTKEKAEEMITVLDGILGSVKLDPTQLKTLTDYKEKLRDVFFKLQPTEEAKKAWDALWKAINGGDTDAGTKAKSDLVKSLDSMIDKAKEVETIMNNIIDSTLNIADALGITFSDDTQDAINHFKGGIGSIISGLTSAKSAVELFKGTDTTLKNLSLAGVALGVAFATISWISNTKVRAANKEIEAQEKALKKLERAYDRLEEVQDGLVGSDWVRNQQAQISNLSAQVAAFQAQLEAERSKGKKADEDAIEDYTDKILDAQREMRELQRGIAEEMSGTDLASAAKDFAQSWLDAYLSFDDTMGALKSSFKDMMKTMVQNSMMAKLVQKRLEPVFNAIDKAYEDAELTPAEWQSIMDMGNKAIEYIDEDLTHLAEMLGLREQLGTQQASDLTGIAKGVAQASEETVLTLAGYANSILYYQIGLKNDVAAIRAVLEGKVAAVAPAASNEGFNVGQLVTLQQQSLNQLQAINMNTGNTVSQLQALNAKFDSVISAQGTSARKVVNTRMSN